MVSILMEPKYADSLWCKHIHRGLVESLRQKRIPFCEMFDVYPPDSEGVFVIASDYHWIKSVLEQFNRAGIQPILLSNQLEKIPGCLYSCVCSDISASMQNLMTSLSRAGHERLAFYGANENSLSDMGRVNAALTFRTPGRQSLDIYYNHGSLANCFSDYFPHCREYDAVICPNDIAARSLVQHLSQSEPDRLGCFPIISCAKTDLSDTCPHILSVDLNLLLFGVEAVRIFEQCRKYPHLSGITSCILWDFPPFSSPTPSKSLKLSLPLVTETFYDDRELLDLLVIDRVISHADETDRVILHALLCGKSYEEIAADSFLTESGIKYRIKRLLSLSQAESREALLSLLQSYQIFT